VFVLCSDEAQCGPYFAFTLLEAHGDSGRILACVQFIVVLYSKKDEEKPSKIQENKNKKAKANTLMFTYLF